MSDEDDAIPGLGLDDLPVFEAMANRLAAKGEYKRLERLIRKMLHAMTSSKRDEVGGRPVRDIERDLWRRLRDTYDRHLKEPAKAQTAGRLLIQLAPDDAVDRIALAALLARNGDLDEAAQQYDTVIARMPSPVEPLHALFAVHLARKDTDAAGCAAAALAFHGAATPQELAWVERARRDRLPGEVTPFGPEAWRLLAGADASAHVDAVLTCIARAVFHLRGRRPASDVLDARFVPPEIESPHFRSAFAWARSCLGLPSCTHFADLGAELDAPAPSLACGRLEDDQGGTPLRQVLFVAGRQAVFHRPAHLLLYRYSTVAELTVLFFSALSLVRPETPIPSGIDKNVASVTLLLRGTLQDVERDRLATAVGALVEDGARVNLKMWRREQELLAARVGLLLAGDLGVAHRVLGAESYVPDSSAPDETMRELAAFAASMTHAALRKHLGLASDVVIH